MTEASKISSKQSREQELQYYQEDLRAGDQAKGMRGCDNKGISSMGGSARNLSERARKEEGGKEWRKKGTEGGGGREANRSTR